MNSFDVAAFHFVNRVAGHHPFFDHTMAFFAQYALEIYALLFIVAWFSLPKAETKQRHALIVAVIAGILALCINVAISHFWYRPRPFAALPKGTYTRLIPHVADASFPSDHASGSVAFAAASWGKSTIWVRYVFTVLAITVMFARVYVGVHWVTDVLASAVVGVIASRVAWRFSRWIYPITSFGLRLCRYGSAPHPNTPLRRTHDDK